MKDISVYYVHIIIIPECYFIIVKYTVSVCARLNCSESEAGCHLSAMYLWKPLKMIRCNA